MARDILPDLEALVAQLKFERSSDNGLLTLAFWGFIILMVIAFWEIILYIIILIGLIKWIINSEEEMRILAIIVTIGASIFIFFRVNAIYTEYEANRTTSKEAKQEESVSDKSTENTSYQDHEYNTNSSPEEPIENEITNKDTTKEHKAVLTPEEKLAQITGEKISENSIPDENNGAEPSVLTIPESEQ